VDDLLTTKQLQDLLQVDRITIYRMLNDGRLRGFKVGGQWRFSRRDIEQWLYEQQSDLAAVQDTSAKESDLLPPSETLPLSCIQAIQSIYAEALDIAAVTVDPNGSPLVEVSNSCDFCNLIRSTDEGRRRCAASWKQAGSSGPDHRCHAGLLCVGVPVAVEDRWPAIVASCQFVAGSSEGTAEEWPVGIPVLALELGLSENDLWTAANTVRVLPEPALPRVARLLRQVADTFGEIAQERAGFIDRLHRIAEMTNF
jgi:excisionase family DNA binding protein